MKILICTQAVDSTDSNLGFFVEWIRTFAEHCESVEVVCLREGSYDLPANVHVHALRSGEQRAGSRNRTADAAKFLSLVWRLRHEYDLVFVHMNPEYIVLGGLFWRLWHKPIGLWYAHKSVTAKLRIATLLATHVFTVSPQSFRIGTKKRHAVGHGIDTNRFSMKGFVNPSSDRGFTKPPHSEGMVRIITIGRISASKHLIEMLPVLDVLHTRGAKFSLTIVGAPITDADREYQVELIREIRSRPYHAAVHLAGAVEHAALAAELARADVALNFSSTGNMDKTGLEPLVAGVPLVTTNTAFAEIAQVPGVFLVHTPSKLADAILVACHTDASDAAALVREKHSLAALIPRILTALARSE